MDQDGPQWLDASAKMPILAEVGVGSGIWAVDDVARPVVLVHLLLLHPSLGEEPPFEETVEFGLLADSALQLGDWMSSMARQVQASLS